MKVVVATPKDGGEIQVYRCDSPEFGTRTEAEAAGLITRGLAVENDCVTVDVQSYSV